MCPLSQTRRLDLGLGCVLVYSLLTGAHGQTWLESTEGVPSLEDMFFGDSFVRHFGIEKELI